MDNKLYCPKCCNDDIGDYFDDRSDKFIHECQHCGYTWMEEDNEEEDEEED